MPDKFLFMVESSFSSIRLGGNGLLPGILCKLESMIALGLNWPNVSADKKIRIKSIAGAFFIKEDVIFISQN